MEERRRREGGGGAGSRLAVTGIVFAQTIGAASRRRSFSRTMPVWATLSAPIVRPRAAFAPGGADRFKFS